MKNLKRYNQLFESTQELTQEQKDWLDKCTKYGNWSINPQTGLVDVKGNFYCSWRKLSDFKGVRFGHVSGDFKFNNNEFKSLDGAPQRVDGNFGCSYNELKSLEGLPAGFSVGGNFICYYNKLESLKGLPDGFKAGGIFNCSYNKLESINGLPDGFKVGLDFDCSDNNLTSLEGLPDGFSVDRTFDCSYNKLESLKGLPDGFRAGVDFNCENNRLKSLEGLPDGFKVIRNFICSDNELESLKGLPDGFKVSGDFYCSDNPISERAIKGVVQRMGDKEISLGQAVAGYWGDIPKDDKFYLAKSAFDSTVIEDPEIVRSEDAIQIYIDTSLQFSRSEREEYKIKLSKRGDIDQEMIDGLDSMVRVLNRHK